MSEQFDMGSLFSQLGQVQENLRKAQEAAAAQLVEGSAGGGVVRVKVSGALDFKEVRIDPSVVDPADVEMLQDLVLAAVRDAMDKAGGLANSTLGQAGLDLPGLRGILGIGG